MDWRSSQGPGLRNQELGEGNLNTRNPDMAWLSGGREPTEQPLMDSAEKGTLAYRHGLLDSPRPPWVGP